MDSFSYFLLLILFYKQMLIISIFLTKSILFFQVVYFRKIHDFFSLFLSNY